MKITKLEVKNYRILEDFSIDIEDELSLIIGKNNTGKTSLLSILDKFLNSKEFNYEDFNLKLLAKLKKIIVNNSIAEVEKSKLPLGIKLSIIIDYYEMDNLRNVSEFMMDLDPENSQIKIKYEYSVNKETIEKIISDFTEYKKIEKLKKEKKEDYEARNIDDFLRVKYSKYFQRKIKAVDLLDSNKYKIQENFNKVIDKMINFEYISASREVSNKDGNTQLSSLSHSIYKKVKDNDHLEKELDLFTDTLRDTDKKLDKVYKKLFNKTLKNIKIFGGMKPKEMNLEIASKLQESDILENNTTVYYSNGNNHDQLPENYNGLGYMNLINMIFKIEVVINKFKGNESEKMADINILYIEEPEAHTHPQMQYIFINNIKEILRKGIEKNNEKRDIQFIISTHSSHIVSESEFDDIKYLKFEKDIIKSKNLKDLEEEYEKDGKEANYRFLKQYLTLNRSEIFFADKVVFIEGDTERILLPSMMKKMDLKVDETSKKLLSQNISVIDVGNYVQIFEKFIDFIGIKTLIITDIDSGMKLSTLKEMKKQLTGEEKKKLKQKVRVDDQNASVTTNPSLKFFYETDELDYYKDKKVDDLKLSKKRNQDKEKSWQHDKEGYLLCAYQISEKNAYDKLYHARSFEDAFIHWNKQFIINNEEIFKSLKNFDFLKDDEKEAYKLAERCIGKKPAFAIEILLSSDKDYSDWVIPKYIERGLKWLRD